MGNGRDDGQDDQRLAALRQQIRELDDGIFQLVARRLEVAREIGAVKLRRGLPIKDYKVEKEVVARAADKARELGLYEELGEALSRLLIRYAVSTQDELGAKTRRRAPAAAVRRILIAGGRGHMGLWLSDFFESFGHQVSHYDAAASKDDEGSARYPLVADFAAAARAHDVVVLSTPISATAALIEQLAASGTQALCFDICSLKTPLVPAIRAAAAKGLHIASAHPMFGPRVELLAGRNIIVCHVADRAATDAVRALFADTTASLIEMPLERHDELMSYVLGLSHLTNLVFASVLAGSGLPFAELRRAASTTFNAQLDVAGPVAHENRELYYEIQAENGFTPALVKALRAELDAYAAAIAARDRQAFVDRMARSRDYLRPDD